MSDNIRVGLIGYGYASKNLPCAPLIAGHARAGTGGNLQQR